MDRASSKSYVSKKVLVKYQKEREKLMQQQQNDVNGGSLKQFSEDANMKEELKQSQQSNLQQVDERLSDDELSCEEVDSDDLGDDIAQKRQPQQQAQMQMQQQMNFIQPQQQMIQPQNMAMPMMQQMQPQQQIQPQNYNFQQLSNLQPQQQMIGQQPQQQMMFQQQQPQNSHQGFFKRMVQGASNMLSGSNSASDKKQQKMSNSNKRQKVQQPIIQQQQMIQPQNIQLAYQQQQPQNQMMYQQPQQMQQMFQANQPSLINNQGQRKYKQEVDTNVFQISMKCLKENAEIATGDPVYCEGCQAMFNKHSQIEKDGDKQVWICEFCNHKNNIQLEQEEIPKTDTVNYIIEAAPYKEEVKEEQKTSKTDTGSEISIVYCIDISGSMGYRAGKSTRLHCVQDTIAGQIEEMVSEHPNRKIGLVTFTDKIEIIGDGSMQIDIGQNQLMDYDFIKKTGIACAANQMDKPLVHSKDTLIRKVKEMKPMGSTALGPGLLGAVALAGEGKPGSQVIVCTDGASNMGLGAFNRSQNEQQSRDFYEKVAKYAQDKGVTVHIVTIIGSECNIDGITSVAELTGGQIERVDPAEIKSNFQDFLAKPVLATQVKLKVKLHKGLEFRNEQASNLTADRTVLIRQFGNVNEDTDVTFEYRVKPVRELVKMLDIDLTQIKSFPFQAQIIYTALDGAKCVRVITNQMEISNDREEVEKQANFEILGVNAIQQSSKLARQGEFKKAQVAAKAWDNRLLSNTVNQDQREQLGNFRSNMNGIYNIMNQQNTQQPMQQQFSMGMMQQPQQRMQQSDAVSQQLYSNSRMNKAQFQKKKQ